MTWTQQTSEAASLRVNCRLATEYCPKVEPSVVVSTTGSGFGAGAATAGRGAGASGAPPGPVTRRMWDSTNHWGCELWITVPATAATTSTATTQVATFSGVAALRRRRARAMARLASLKSEGAMAGIMPVGGPTATP